MSSFDAINYSMTTIATGGFSPHNDSVAHFHSPAMEYTSTLFCFLSGINFILLFRLFVKRDVTGLLNNTEIKVYTGLTLVFTAFVMLMLMHSNGYAPERALRCALYQVVSFLTTTGLYNDDAAKWPHVTWMVLALCMFCGACAGSTSGGFKCIRVAMLFKVMRNEFKQILHPKAVLPLKIGDTNVNMQQRVTLMAFLTTYLVLCVFCAVVMIVAGVDITNAITITISTLSNVGPTLGNEIGPTMSWNDLPDFAKWICSVLMLMGRLEIFSVLIIFTPLFLKDR
jgi:trk system potassium uptake protein TrkH